MTTDYEDIDTICDRCSRTMDISEAYTVDTDCGEWEGATLCLDCDIAVREEESR